MYRREATIRYFLRRGFALREAEDLTQEVQIRLWLTQQRGTEPQRGAVALYVSLGVVRPSASPA
ncbi:MAG: hypothetical protein KatS3mg022_1217 [Armatimonadota bacterium]|nr:MAG: hypothetical protein KatS3mg022_1217 [Armatimonadota bacterium]